MFRKLRSFLQKTSARQQPAAAPQSAAPVQTKTAAPVQPTPAVPASDSEALPSILVSGGVLQECRIPDTQEELILPENVREIACRIFAFSAKRIVLPGGLKKIGRQAFASCSALEEIYIPDSVTEIAGSAFQRLPALRKARLPGHLQEFGWHMFADCNRLEEVELAPGLTTIGYSAFENCSKLTRITIPDSVVSINSYAFRGCISLQEITLPPRLQSISYQVFGKCCSLREIRLPATVTEIGFAAFGGCTALEQVTLPAALTVLSDNLFSGCSSLEEITLPEGLQELQKGAFSGCSSLRRIVIPDSVTQISRYAFLGCRKLEDVLFSQPERFPLAFCDTPFGSTSYSNINIRIPVRLPLELVGNHTGKELWNRGYTFLPADRDYHIELPGEDGIVIVSSWEDEDGPDEDGFGREEYYNWWMLDEQLKPIPGIKMWHSYSHHDIRCHQEEWDSLRAKAAQIVRKRHETVS